MCTTRAEDGVVRNPRCTPHLVPLSLAQVGLAPDLDAGCQLRSGQCATPIWCSLLA